MLPDPDEPGAFLTFPYRNITPGDSVLLDDIAIITGIVYNSKHEKPRDMLLKAVEEGRVEEFLQVVRNNRYQQSKTISLGLGRTIEDVEENITHPETRNALSNAIKGGAAPRHENDSLTDVDTFLSKLRDKNPKKQHRRIEAHNISKLCEKYPGKYRAPSDVYFGEIETVFFIFKDVEIDMAVLRVESEIAQEDFDKRQKPQKPIPTQSSTYQSPLRRHDDEEDW